jgi:hypothetical protein
MNYAEFHSQMTQWLDDTGRSFEKEGERLYGKIRKLYARFDVQEQRFADTVFIDWTLEIPDWRGRHGLWALRDLTVIESVFALRVLLGELDRQEGPEFRDAVLDVQQVLAFLAESRGLPNLRSRSEDLPSSHPSYLDFRVGFDHWYEEVSGVLSEAQRVHSIERHIGELGEFEQRLASAALLDWVIEQPSRSMVALQAILDLGVVEAVPTLAWVGSKSEETIPVSVRDRAAEAARVLSSAIEVPD